MRLLDVPVIAQPTDYECGNTSLAAVAQFHGKHYSTTQLAELARTTTAGTDHRNLIEAAVATGATVFARADGSLDELATFVGLGLPVIIGWWSMTGDSHYDPTWSLHERRDRDCGHYSVVCGVIAAGFMVMDPQDDDVGQAIGMCQLPAAELDAVWYDTDGDAYERVNRWYMVLNYDGRRFADTIGGGEDYAAAPAT